MFKELIGNQSSRVKNVVERGAVKRFAEAIGDLYPIYFDEETGRKSKYQSNIAPPTFPMTFDYGDIAGLNLPNEGLIHGEQTFHYERPLRVGEEIICYSRVKNYFEKKGNFGEMGFLILESFGEDTESGLIFRSTSTVVISEAVRKVLAK
ncbi:MaoC family dehydratase N-terminal domain-containing protein [Neobacillus sp. MER 74]|uniref:MaoC family dehydratase N-terminal domain-containing protein n=1 Tax=Neobacillus sp. MER 74 TaxID=2939566 RepID=UPI0020422B07|nr:MaoC family dehydratase N-terminal domain-containing protein [Neobacillus sp. MER 74]MCM3116897.1 MaoC family dehydratase N-terminal domain-containing protein [Neobacillus sp. MER 74]